MRSDHIETTLAALAEWHGRPLSVAAVGKRLAVSGRVVRSRIAELEEAGLLWLLPPLPAAGALRARKTPKLYLNALSGSPAAESNLLRAVCRKESSRNPPGSTWYFGGYGVGQVELVVQRGKRRIGFTFLQEKLPGRRCFGYLKRVLSNDIIQAAFALYPGRWSFFAAPRLVVLPASELLDRYSRWTSACLQRSPQALHRLVRRYNVRRSRAWLRPGTAAWLQPGGRESRRPPPSLPFS